MSYITYETYKGTRERIDTSEREEVIRLAKFTKERYNDAIRNCGNSTASADMYWHFLANELQEKLSAIKKHLGIVTIRDWERVVEGNIV